MAQGKKLQLAVSKTETTIIVARRRVGRFEIEIDNSTITTVQCLKYLDVSFDRNTTMRNHIDRIDFRANKATTSLW